MIDGARLSSIRESDKSSMRSFKLRRVRSFTPMINKWSTVRYRYVLMLRQWGH